MAILKFTGLAASVVFLHACVSVYTDQRGVNTISNTRATTHDSYIFRNIVYFKNASPYCTAKVFSGLVKQPVHAKKRFNPVKESFVLKKGGGEHFIEYNFNADNYYRTKVEWYGLRGRYLNTEYIGHAASSDIYHYNINKQHMGEQAIELSNKSRQECWRGHGKNVNVNIYQ